MRRHEGFLKTVGLERALLFRFLHEQKMKALGRVITVNWFMILPTSVGNVNTMDDKRYVKNPP